MESLLQLRGVRHRYNGRLVLDIPELAIAAGSITGLSGPNGSGKSTLLRLLSLTETPSEGNVAAPGQGITLLPQESYLLRRTVFDNIAYGLRIRGRKEDLPAKVREGLSLVGLAPSFAGRRWYELSGGEAQRVALAARLVLRPACLLLDEPTASVDMKSGQLIQQAILQARAQWGTTLIIASHNRTWLHDLCDRLIFLHNGRQLSCSLDNLLPGPWTVANDRHWQTTLDDGQLVLASPPRGSEQSCILPPTALRPANGKPQAGEQSLRGTITGIFTDRHLQGPCLQVTCGGHHLIATLPPDWPAQAPCQLGQQVTLHYRSEDIVWLD